MSESINPYTPPAAAIIDVVEDSTDNIDNLLLINLHDFEIHTNGVIEAYGKIKEALKRSKHTDRFNLILKKPDSINYQSPIRISRETRSLRAIIDLLCQQADLTWESSPKLTFIPNEPEVKIS